MAGSAAAPSAEARILRVASEATVAESAAAAKVAAPLAKVAATVEEVSEVEMAPGKVEVGKAAVA